MHTNNIKPLTDYYTVATGLNIRYETLPCKGLKGKVGFSTVSKVWEQNLFIIDSLANSGCRYEIGLYDITNPQKPLAFIYLRNLR